MLQLSEQLFCFHDTCNVYLVRSGRDAVLIDFGSGAILSELASLGVECVTDVLMTHHHRDQGQGLAKAVAAGARIWVPEAERELFDAVDQHWQAREIYNNYNMRQDRFSLLEPVPITAILRDYARLTLGGRVFNVVPTPGHTIGSASLLAGIDGRQVAFTGDTIAAPGKVWSMAATQWSYNGAEGAAASIASLVGLRARRPDCLLPSHGEPIEHPEAAIDLLVDNLWQLLQYRGESTRLLDWLKQPYAPITPHLLQNRTSTANSYVLLSSTGKALLIDYGYDMMVGFPAGSDRASRRPWLYTLGALKREYEVQRIDVALPTHYHDDHVAGFNLLREVEGTCVWAAENFAAILEQPASYDLPCLWFDPIPVDRVLPLGQPVCWEEYEFRLYELPGHTLYAVAIAFEVDGRRILATGDQYQGDAGQAWNYVYKNKYRFGNYERTAALYEQLNPDIIISGHWAPLTVGPGYFETLHARGRALTQLHRQLLPLDTFHFDAEGFGAWIRPYQVHAVSGQPVPLEIEVRNPFRQRAQLCAELVIPLGWQARETERALMLDGHSTGTLHFCVTPIAHQPVRRARIAVDITVDGRRLGQQAEALVDVEPADGQSFNEVR